MNQELKKILEEVKGKEEEAEKIVIEAKLEHKNIIESAYKEESKIFNEVKNIFEAKLADLEKKFKEEIEQEKNKILQETEKKLDQLSEEREEIVRKIIEFLLSQIKNHGYREG